MSEKKINPEGKVALISGANRGIGKAILLELLKKGAKKIYAGARNTDTLTTLKETYGNRLIPVQLDVTDQESIKKAAQIATDVDILINNAGIAVPRGLLNPDAIESLDHHFNVNVKGLIYLTNAFIKTLISKDAAAIVNIGSVVGLASMPMFGTYSASKAAVHSITQAIRGELAKTNILVSGVYPGPIDTDMTKGYEMEKDSPENVAKNTIQALINGQEDIFPDVMSQQIGEYYRINPKAVEKEFSNYVND